MSSITWFRPACKACAVNPPAIAPAIGPLLAWNSLLCRMELSLTLATTLSTKNRLGPDCAPTWAAGVFAGGEGEACAVKLTPTVRVPIRRPIRAANTAITMAMMMGPKAHSGKPEP